MGLLDRKRTAMLRRKGSLTCLKCRAVKPHSEYPFTLSGRLSTVCRGCSKRKFSDYPAMYSVRIVKTLKDKAECPRCGEQMLLGQLDKHRKVCYAGVSLR